MNYRQQNKYGKQTLKQHQGYEGESIEKKLQRMMTNKEPIGDAVPLTYTDRADGVGAEYNIRTDRWDVALGAMDVASKSYKAQREQRMGERTYDTMTPEQQTEFNTKYPNNKYAKQNKQE